MKNIFYLIIILLKRLLVGIVVRLGVGISLIIFSIYRYIYLLYQSFGFNKNRNNFVTNFLKSFFGDTIFSNSSINFSFFPNIFKPRLFFKSLLDLKHVKFRSELFLALSKLEHKQHVSRLVNFIVKGNIFLIKPSLRLMKSKRTFKGHFFNSIERNFFFENNFIISSSSNYSYKSLVKKRILNEFNKILSSDIINISSDDLMKFSKFIIYIIKNYPFFLVLNIIYKEVFKFKLDFNFIYFNNNNIKYKNLPLKIIEYIYNFTYKYLKYIIKNFFSLIYFPYILLVIFMSIFLLFILFFNILFKFFKIKGFFSDKILLKIFNFIFNKNTLINEDQVIFFKEYIRESFLMSFLILTLRNLFKTKILYFFSKNISEIDEQQEEEENLESKKLEIILFSEENFRSNFVEERVNMTLNTFYLFIILIYFFFCLFIIYKIIGYLFFFNLWFLFFIFFILLIIFIYKNLFLIEFRLLKFFIFADYLKFFKLKFLSFYFNEKKNFMKYLVFILVKISFFCGKFFLNLNFFFDKKPDNNYLYILNIINFYFFEYIFFFKRQMLYSIKKNFVNKYNNNINLKLYYYINKILLLFSIFTDNIFSFCSQFYFNLINFMKFIKLKQNAFFLLKICLFLSIIFIYQILDFILSKLKILIYLIFLYPFIIILFIFFKIRFIFHSNNAIFFLYKKTKGFSNILAVIYTIIFDKENFKKYLFINEYLIKNNFYISKVYNYFLKTREESSNYVFRKFSNEKYFQFILNQENIRNKLNLKNLNKVYLTYISKEEKFSNLFKKSKKYFDNFNLDVEFLKLRIEKNVITENEVNFIIKNKIEELITLLKENKIVQINKGDIVCIKKEKKMKNLLFRLKGKKKHIRKRFIFSFIFYKERKLLRNEINKLLSENKEISNIIESYKSKKEIPFLISQPKFRDIYFRNYIFKRFIIYQKLQTLNGSKHIWLKKWLKNYQINLQIQKLLFDNQVFSFCYRNNIPRNENLKLQYHFMNLIYMKYLFSIKKFFIYFYSIIVFILFFFI